MKIAKRTRMPPPTMRIARIQEMIVMVGLLECERIRMRLAGIVAACVCARVPAVTATGANAGALEDTLTIGLATAGDPCVTNVGARKPVAARARLAVTERRCRLVIKRSSRRCKGCGRRTV